MKKCHHSRTETPFLLIRVALFRQPLGVIRPKQPETMPRRSKTAPRWPQNDPRRPKTVPRRPKTVPRRPETVHDGSRRPPHRLQTEGTSERGSHRGGASRMHFRTQTLWWWWCFPFEFYHGMHFPTVSISHSWCRVDSKFLLGFFA